MSQFAPAISTSISGSGVDKTLSVTDVSDYNNDAPQYVKKSELYYRKVTIKDSILGTDIMSAFIPYGSDTVTFNISLLQVVSVNIELLQAGVVPPYPFQTQFVKYLNV